MKRIMVVVTMVMMVVSMMMALTTAMVGAQAETMYSEAYSNDTQHYVVFAYVDNECVIQIVDIFTLADLARDNLVCSAYAIDCDGLYEIDWSIEDDVFATYGGHWLSGEYVRDYELEYID